MITACDNIKFANSTRFIVLVISLLAFSIVTSNTLILNFTIICMTSNDDGDGNDTVQYDSANPKYDYTPMERTLLISAPYVGNLLGTYPVMFLETTFGARSFFTAFGIISAIATFLVPYLASLSVWLLFAMRFIEGFAAAAPYPVLGTMITKWAPTKETGLFLGLTLCYFQVGPLFTLPVSGALCVSRYGWPAAYYVHGTVTIVIFGLFFLIYRDSPRTHRNVSAKELACIEHGKELSVQKEMPPVPHAAILRDIAVWGIWTGYAGAVVGFQIFFQYGPIYLNKVRNFEIESTGFASALPYLCSFFVKSSAGPLSDRANCCSDTMRAKIFAFISQGFMVACFILLALLPANMGALGQIAYTAAIAFSGLNSVGIERAVQLIAQQHAHFMMSVLSFILCVVAIAEPFFVSFLAPDNTPESWTMMFYIIAGIMVVTNGFFFIVGSAEPAKWTKSNTEQAFACQDKNSHHSLDQPKMSL